MKTTSKLAGLLFCLITLFAFSLRAQPTAPMATQQQQNFQQDMEMQKPLLSLRPGTNAPEIYAGENEDVGEQHILRLLPHRTRFEVSVDSEYLYTDNALLTQHPYISSSEFVNTIQAAFAPTAYRIGPGRVAPQIGYRGQWYDYGLGGHDLSAIDFNVQSVYASARYIFQNNWVAFSEMDMNWFFTHQNISPMFYRELVPTIGAQRLFQVGNDAVFSITAQGDWRDTWQINAPHALQDRADATLSLSFAYQVIPQKLIVQPFYRFQYTYYPKDSNLGPVRQDFLNSFGISAAWYFTPTLSLRAFINDDAKSIASDSIAPRYHDWNAGVDLAYSIRF